MVMPRARSRARESVWVLPRSTLPTWSMIPAAKSSRSVRLVLPASTCARIPRLSEVTSSHVLDVGGRGRDEHEKLPHWGLLSGWRGSTAGCEPATPTACVRLSRAASEFFRCGSRGSFVVLGLLSTFGPISLDLYLPALPQLAAELDGVDVGGAAHHHGVPDRPGRRAGHRRAAVGPVRPQASADDRSGRVRARLAGLRLRLVDHGAAGAAAGPGPGRSGRHRDRPRGGPRPLRGPAAGGLLLPAGAGLGPGAGDRPGAGRPAEPGDELAGHLRRARRDRGGAGAGRPVRAEGEPAARAAAHRRAGGDAAGVRGAGPGPVLRRRGAGRRAGRSVDVRLHRGRDLRAAADLRAQSARVLAGLRAQLRRASWRLRS